jgi:hypothetical protein
LAWKRRCRGEREFSWLGRGDVEVREREKWAWKRRCRGERERSWLGRGDVEVRESIVGLEEEMSR